MRTRGRARGRNQPEESASVLIRPRYRRAASASPKTQGSGDGFKKQGQENPDKQTGARAHHIEGPGDGPVDDDIADDREHEGNEEKKGRKGRAIAAVNAVHDPLHLLGIGPVGRLHPGVPGIDDGNAAKGTFLFRRGELDSAVYAI